MSRICTNCLVAFEKFDITILELPEVHRKNEQIIITINDKHFRHICKNYIKQKGICANTIVAQKFTNCTIYTTDELSSNFK